ncbi:isochorismatase [Alicycliphilus sp. B1]|nr:isochorismatase [Alicycliphilus sp. B1]
MSEDTLPGDLAAYARQGFGAALTAHPPYALLIVDFVNGFADPAVFGGGNIPAAIARTRELLALARSRQWPVAHSRIGFADDDSDANVFSAKVPGMLSLTESAPASAIVRELAPVAGELVGSQDRAIGILRHRRSLARASPYAKPDGGRQCDQRLRARPRRRRHVLRFRAHRGQRLRG